MVLLGTKLVETKERNELNMEDREQRAEEEEYDEGEYEEEYETWATYQESSSHLKPIVIGLIVAFLIGVGAVAYFQWTTDPAKYFDEAPIVNQGVDEPGGLSFGGHAPAAEAVARPPVRTTAPEVAAAEEPAAAAVAEPPTVAPAEPATEQEPEPEPEAQEPAAEVAQAEELAGPPAPAAVGNYEEQLAAAKNTRGLAKRIAAFREVIATNPRGDQALAELAMLLMERKKTRAEALDLATRATEINPDNGMAWLVVGYVNQLDGKRAAAKDAYRKCAGASGPKKYVFECKRLV